MNIRCNILADDIFIFDEIDDNNLNELRRLNTYYKISNDNYFNDIINYKKNKIKNLLSEINERFDYNNKNNNIEDYKHILCEYEIEYKTSIKHLKTKLLYLDKLNDINNNIDRIKLDVSNNLQMINDLKRLIYYSYGCLIIGIIFF